jgi:DNA-binding transcriptional LysR family regulator
LRFRLDQLEALVWISRLGSFRATAQHLNISQPAVSGRIRELERHTGATVIDRSQSRPRITRRGAEIVRYAEQMMRLGESLAAHLNANHALVGTIRMGVAESFAVTHLSKVLARFAVRHPAAHVELDVDFSVNLDRKLRAAQLDIAFLHAPTPGPTVAIESLMEVEVAWFASPRLRLPKRAATPADLVGVPILTNPRSSHLYGSIVDWFGTAGLTPQRINTCNSLAIIAKLAVDGFGISVLPPVVVAAELKNRTLRKIPTRPGLQPSHVTIAYRTDPEIGDLASVVELVREVLRNK